MLVMFIANLPLSVQYLYLVRKFRNKGWYQERLIFIESLSYRGTIFIVVDIFLMITLNEIYYLHLF